MKKNLVAGIAMIVLGSVFSFPSRSSGQQGQVLANQPVRYRLVDLGTLGGPNSYQPFGYASAFLTEASLSAGGAVAGMADTSAPDPNAPNCFFDCFVDHAFRWKDGVRTDLEALPGAPGSSSAVTWISPNGLISGISENGDIDPLLGFPVIHGVVWQDGRIIDLKTLEGGYESWANATNNHGQAVGFASNGTYDVNSLQGFVTQSRSFLWQDGAMKDLGTLGGTDAEALFINEHGQIVGQSYTVNSIPNPVPHCGDSPLTLHAFIWENSKMMDLDTLGGSCAFAYALNNLGQVVGQSNLTGEQLSHPFIWDRGKMKDLGALGGTYGYASWLNDSGEVVGGATNEGDQALLAFRWKDGAMTNLGTLSGDACSVSDAVNSSGQIVGGSGLSLSAFFPACTDPVEHAVLWKKGRVIDLNSFVPAGSDLILNEAVFINDSGEISGFGTLPNGDQHAILLIPCGPDDSEACQEVGQDANATQSKPAPIASPATTAGQPNLTPRRMGVGYRGRLARGYRSATVGTPSAPYNLGARAQDTYQIVLNWQEASGKNLSGFNIYRCRGCSSPPTQGTKIASVSASVLTFTDGSASNPLGESTTYTYQATAFSGGGQSGPSNAASTTTNREPAPTNLTSFASRRGFDDIVRLSWTNNSTDDDSYHIERCAGATCTNFSEIAKTGANVTTYIDPFQFVQYLTFRYRVRAHSPGGYSGYSNIRNQTLP
jgi:probable HAF family extracellular repeat protein